MMTPSSTARHRRAVRMKDIAERSNVSLTTVSRLLRGKDVDRFPEATRERIFRVARELGWSPNRLVQGIQTGRTGTMGVVLVPFDTHWQRLMVALHRELLQADNIPLALYPDYDVVGPGGTGTEFDHLRHLMERRVDGLICWPLFQQDAIDYLTTVCATQVPVVTLEFELPDPTRSIVVRTQEAAGMRAAVDHLIALGHRRIGYCGKRDSHSWAVGRRAAFAEAMQAAGLEPAFAEDLAKNDPSAGASLREDLPRATAVVAGSEQIAMAVWHIAREAGLHVPRDLSIVGFGRLWFEFAVWPKFTCVDQRPDDIARAAAALVLDPAARRALAGRSVDIEPHLVVGDTTAPPLP